MSFELVNCICQAKAASNQETIDGNRKKKKMKTIDLDALE